LSISESSSVAGYDMDRLAIRMQLEDRVLQEFLDSNTLDKRSDGAGGNCFFVTMKANNGGQDNVNIMRHNSVMFIVQNINNTFTVTAATGGEPILLSFRSEVESWWASMMSEFEQDPSNPIIPGTLIKIAILKYGDKAPLAFKDIMSASGTYIEGVVIQGYCEHYNTTITVHTITQVEVHSTVYTPTGNSVLRVEVLLHNNHYYSLVPNSKSLLQALFFTTYFLHAGGTSSTLVNRLAPILPRYSSIESALVNKNQESKWYLCII
jgi:hypothetical protein